MKTRVLPGIVAGATNTLPEDIAPDTLIVVISSSITPMVLFKEMAKSSYRVRMQPCPSHGITIVQKRGFRMKFIHSWLNRLHHGNMGYEKHDHGPFPP